MNDTQETTTTDREQFLTDILCTAVEGGIGDWSETFLSTYDWDCPVVNRGVTLLIEGLDADDFRVPLLDSSEYLQPEYVDDNHHVVRVTLDTIRKGVSLIDRKEPEIEINDDYMRIVKNASHRNDTCPDNMHSPGDIDADVASCIVQAGLFGKIVFG